MRSPYGRPAAIASRRLPERLLAFFGAIVFHRPRISVGRPGMRRFAILILCCVIASTGIASARGRYEKMKDCADLPTCMAILDAAIRWRDNDTELGDERQIALRLEAFGHAAKSELLKRTGGPDREWRIYAAAILEWWPNFDDADVPALVQVLQFEEGGWAGVPLAKIRTPAAIRALLADIGRFHFNRYYNRPGSTELVGQLGKAVLPYMLGALENAQANPSWQLETLTSGLGNDAIPMVVPWTNIAIDRNQPSSRRVAALRGLAAIGYRGAFVGNELHPLLQDGDLAVREFALTTLGAMRDPVSYPVLIPPVLGACRPVAHWPCSERLAAFGDGLLPYDGRIENEFLYSQDCMDREAGAAILGYVGYRPAIPRLSNCSAIPTGAS
jgi:hypothetical protein